MLEPCREEVDMGVEAQLQPGEEILYRAHPTRIGLIPPLAGAALAAAGGLAAWNGLDRNLVLTLLAGAVAALLLLVALWRYVVLRSNEYILTNRRVVRQSGILAKSSVDSYLDKLNNVEHRQSLWGRLLNYGDVEIDTASEVGTTVFPRIASPLEFKRQILAATDAFHTVRGNFPAGPPAAPASPSGADRLRQLKQLLDEGLISQEEFEAKRRQLLEQM